MEREAAQGARSLHDDTAVRLLAWIAENRDLGAAAQAQGVSTTTERPGMPTTTLVVQGGEPTAILSDSSRRQAGETLQGVLDKRAAGLAKPLAISDALARDEVAEASRRLRWHYLAPGRRPCSALAEVWPHACQVGLAGRRQVCDHEEQGRGSAEPRGTLGVPPEAAPAADGRAHTVAGHAERGPSGGTQQRAGQSPWL
jgi:hypothetical protein